MKEGDNGPPIAINFGLLQPVQKKLRNMRSEFCSAGENHSVGMPSEEIGVNPFDLTSLVTI